MLGHSLEDTLNNLFTIQNVSIKYKNNFLEYYKNWNLQYKMFLLNIRR